MNCIYRSIWNETTGTFVAASENASSAGKRNSSGPMALSGQAHFVLRALAIGLALGFGATVYALPAGGVVAAGAANIGSIGGATTITQSTQNAVINWQSFNIGARESVLFVQPNRHSVALNRVLGSDPSSIFGSLSANGTVFLVNPNGILFGKGSAVNVGGLVASTLNLADNDFMAGRYLFFGEGVAPILNQGGIQADGGYVALLGARVNNEGVISARLGSVALAAGKAITLDVAGDGLLNVAVNQGVVDALVQNGGLIRADGGQVLMTAQAAGSLLRSAVNNTGTIQAQTLENHNGTIRLLGGMQAGSVGVGGTLDASAPAGGNGGFIETSAAYVKIDSDARITTAAPLGQTGAWLIDPLDFTIGDISTGGDIAGSTLSAMLVTNNVTIRTEAGTNDPNNLYAGTVGNGDIHVNQPISWTASGVPTTLSLYAVNDINLNAAVTATKGNFVSIAGRDINALRAITTTDGSLLMCAVRDINIENNGGDRLGAITTTRGNFTAVAGHDIRIDLAKITTTGSSGIPAESLGLDLGLVLSAGNDGRGPGATAGTVVFTPGTSPAAVTNAPVTLYYNPVSYTTPTNYSGHFTLTEGASLTPYMLVFPDGGSKVYDGTTGTTLSGLKGLPAGVTLVAGAGSTANFDNPDVGVGKVITFNGYTLSGADAGKYAFTGAAAGPFAAVCCAPRTTAAITATPAPTPPPTPAPTIAPTPEPTPAPTIAPTPSPTPAPTIAPTPEPTPAPTIAPTPSPTPAPTIAPTPKPTPAPTIAPTPSPTPAPTIAPTPSPTPAPTIAPTPSPTPGPTIAPTPSPTPGPTIAPTPSPTPGPTIAPTPSPTPAPEFPVPVFPAKPPPDVVPPVTPIPWPPTVVFSQPPPELVTIVPPVPQILAPPIAPPVVVPIAPPVYVAPVLPPKQDRH